MAKKISDAERMMHFVRTAPVATVQVIMDLARAELKSRTGQTTATKAKPTRVTRVISTTPAEEPQNAA